MKPIKPLAGKAYGSIGHLPNSRIGTGDHHVHAGQAAICTEKPRKGDRIIVSEKLDGACCAVANIDGEIVALTRAGYRAKDALYDHLKLFDVYVSQHLAEFSELVSPGERIVGEWLALAHGTVYDPEFPTFSPFVVFDILRDGKRVLFEEFSSRIPLSAPFRRAIAIHNREEPLSVIEALAVLAGPLGYPWEPRGFHGAMEAIEGAVWRVEREGRVDFLAKYVRPDKIDGRYLPNISGEAPIWMWNPEQPKMQEAA